jgi:twinkle protein
MGVCIGHTNCPKCGSKDNVAIYEDGSEHCFTPDCGYFKKATGERVERTRVTEKRATPLQYDGEYLQLGSRGIDKAQVKKYGVKTRPAGTVIFPYRNKDGDIVASKLRNPKKQFMYTGDKEKLELFGQSVFGTGGKYLTITEGEFDAMACRQMIGDYPVVSIHSSTMAKRDIKNNLDFVESYEKIYLCLDNDEAGRKATQDIAELLTPGKVFIVPLSEFKDANEYLLAGATKEFKNTWWGAKKYSPVGVVTLSDGFDKYLERLNTKIIEIPDYWGEAKKMLNGGFAVGEITTITADTSIGKTTQLVNLFEGILKLNPQRNITVLMLETTVGELVQFVCKKEFGIDIDVGDEYCVDDMVKLREKYNSIEWTKRLHVIDHIGSLSGTEEIIQRLSITARTTKSDLILVDPIQQATPSIDHEVIRHFMDECLKVAQQIKAALVLTSHIKVRQKKDPYDITEDDAIGSSAIKQVTWTQILLARDKMAENDDVKNSTKIIIPKCRRTGRTGQAGWMKYLPITGGFEKTTDPLAEITEGEDEWGVD